MLFRSSDVPAAIRLSRATLRNIHQNLFWAFFYNVVGIPLAAGMWIPLTGWEMNPMFGAAAMSLSSVCVVSNALRLNLFKVHDTDRDKPLKRQPGKRNETAPEAREIKEAALKTLYIEGMMCGHCERTVKNVLEALEGVVCAEVSHEKGTAVVEVCTDVSDEALAEAVEAEDYKVIKIQ